MEGERPETMSKIRNVEGCYIPRILRDRTLRESAVARYLFSIQGHIRHSQTTVAFSQAVINLTAISHSNWSVS